MMARVSAQTAHAFDRIQAWVGAERALAGVLLRTAFPALSALAEVRMTKGFVRQGLPGQGS